MDEKVIDLGDKEVAIITGNKVRLNQLKYNAKDEYDYNSIYLTKEMIIKLAEELQTEGS